VSRTEALTIAKLIRAVARSEEDECAESLGLIVKHERIINLRIAAFICGNDLIFAVPGSNDLADWVANFNSRLDTAEICQKKICGHKGAIINALALYPFVVRVLSENAGKSVTFGGHSAGGQIAEIFGAVFGATVYTFGSPRVFSQETAIDVLSSTTRRYRFTHQSDPIPSLPLRRFRCLFGGASFAHASPELHLEGSGGILVDKREHTLSKCVQLWWDLARRRLPKAIVDHHLDQYIATLEKGMK
jgi:hypothetical protein